MNTELKKVSMKQKGLLQCFRGTEETTTRKQKEYRAKKALQNNNNQTKRTTELQKHQLNKKTTAVLWRDERNNSNKTKSTIATLWRDRRNNNNETKGIQSKKGSTEQQQ